MRFCRQPDSSARSTAAALWDFHDTLHWAHIKTALTADALILQNIADPARLFDALHWTDLLTRSAAYTAAAIDLKRHSHPSSRFLSSLCIYPLFWRL